MRTEKPPGDCYGRGDNLSSVMRDNSSPDVFTSNWGDNM